MVTYLIDTVKGGIVTDTQVVQMIQSSAVEILLEETFTHIKSTMDEHYLALGKTNARILNVSEVQFMYKGVIYPETMTPIGYHKKTPTLHYSLLTELDTINQMVAQADYHYIKNFFVAVVNQSKNCIVLDSLLPAILIQRLKEELSEPSFKILDSGLYGRLQQEPISETRQTIEDIKTHYKTTIQTVQYMLMDKLLLES